MNEPDQLVLLAPTETDVPGEGHKSPHPTASPTLSRTQLTELPGETFEDIFPKAGTDE